MSKPEERSQIFPAGTVIPGKTGQGEYRIESLLGEGGYGAVYAATQLSLGRVVALKVLHPDVLGRGAARERFVREAQLAQSLSHPNTVRLFDFGETEGRPFIIYELLKGRPVDAVLQREGPFSIQRTIRVASQTLKALMEAHARGIVHRDIKPGNLFLCDFDGEPDFVKVLDFGIASAGEASRGATLTAEGMTVGTPAYMAPEQALAEELDGRADIYSVGLVMAELLSGRQVFAGESLMRIVMAQASPDRPPIGAEVIASPLGPVIQRATAKRKDLRFPNARAMLDMLEAVSARAQQSGAAPASNVHAQGHIGSLGVNASGLGQGAPVQAMSPYAAQPAPGSPSANPLGYGPQGGPQGAPQTNASATQHATHLPSGSLSSSQPPIGYSPFPQGMVPAAPPTTLGGAYVAAPVQAGAAAPQKRSTAFVFLVGFGVAAACAGAGFGIWFATSRGDAPTKGDPKHPTKIVIAPPVVTHAAPSSSTSGDDDFPDFDVDMPSLKVDPKVLAGFKWFNHDRDALLAKLKKNNLTCTDFMDMPDGLGGFTSTYVCGSNGVSLLLSCVGAKGRSMGVNSTLCVPGSCEVDSTSACSVSFTGTPDANKLIADLKAP